MYEKTKQPTYKHEIYKTANKHQRIIIINHNEKGDSAIVLFFTHTTGDMLSEYTLHNSNHHKGKIFTNKAYGNAVTKNVVL